jgi:hypothetical protein
MKQLQAVAAAFLFVLMAAGRANAASILYAADGSAANPSNLYIIDPVTGGIISTVGAIGFTVTGLAFHPTTGVLYGTTGLGAGGDGLLITIDTTTGAGSLVGPIDLAFQTAADIAFSATGTLYGWIEPGDDDLATIDLTTGQGTIVGDAAMNTARAGLAIDSAGNFFFGGFESLGLGLYPIDPVTGAPTGFIPYAPESDFGLGLAFNEFDVLYGLERVDQITRNLVTIDTGTGAVTVIGPTVERLDALAFQITQVPEPATLSLWLAGAAAIGWRLRRRRS